MFMSDGIRATTECGSCDRMCVGESLCKVIYTNKGSDDGSVILSHIYISNRLIYFIVPSLDSWL